MLDLRLPDMTGFELMQKIQGESVLREVPVVVFTGHAVEHAEREVIEAGCDRFLVKGASPEPVIQAIREVLAR